jgi:hypothetical protein
LEDLRQYPHGTGVKLFEGWSGGGLPQEERQQSACLSRQVSSATPAWTPVYCNICFARKRSQIPNLGEQSYGKNKGLTKHTSPSIVTEIGNRTGYGSLVRIMPSTPLFHFLDVLKAWDWVRRMFDHGDGLKTFAGSNVRDKRTRE